MKIRDRVKKLVRVKASKLRPSPWNWRIHPDRQREVMQGILGEIGIAGAVLARELGDGTYALIDGHLRREELGEHKVPVLVVDLDEEEAKKLLACYDPVSQLAEKDAKMLGKLLKEVDTSSESLAGLFSDLLGNKEVKDLSLNIDEGEEEEEILPSDIGLVPSHVRMVQLFLNTETLPEFEEMVQALSQKYKTQSLTDTVLECLRRASRKSQKLPA